MAKSIETGIERIHPKRRTSIGSYVVGTWFMQDISGAARLISFAQKPDTHAKNFMALLGEEEYRAARQQIQDVTPDGTRHIAFQQMLLSTKVVFDRYTNKRVYPTPDFLVATKWVESDTYREKLDAELSISELVDTKLGDDARSYYRDIAERTLDAQGHTTDLRQLTARTIHDAKFWLES